jgi:RND family efflux transporter MFP subunit
MRVRKDERVEDFAERRGYPAKHCRAGTAFGHAGGWRRLRGRRLMHNKLRLWVAAGVIVSVGIAGPIARARDAMVAEPFDCVIEPQRAVKLSSAVAGVIREVSVDRGDVVRRGQVLAKLEAAVEEANLALARAKASSDAPIQSAEAKLEFLRRKHERSQELVVKKIVAEVTYDENLANARVAEQDVRTAQLNAHIAELEVKQSEAVVEQRALRSPLDGIVTDVLLHPGEYRNDQSPILTLAQIDPLRVEVFVPTRFYGQIGNGETAIVEPEAPIGGQYEATVTVVDRVLDAASGTFGVRLRLPNPNLKLPAGLKCKIKFPNIAAPTIQTADQSRLGGELR